MNNGTIVQQNSRGSACDDRHHFFLCLFDSEPWKHCPQVISFPFLLVLILRMDHGAISNRQIIWWGSLMFAPIKTTLISKLMTAVLKQSGRLYTLVKGYW